jgi:hypothetical protein
MLDLIEPGETLDCERHEGVDAREHEYSTVCLEKLILDVVLLLDEEPDGLIGGCVRARRGVGQGNELRM